MLGQLRGGQVTRTVSHTTDVFDLHTPPINFLTVLDHSTFVCPPPPPSSRQKVWKIKSLVCRLPTGFGIASSYNIY